MTKRQTRPTGEQMAWLRRISRSPMMAVYVPGKDPQYSLSDGIPVPYSLATLLIRQGWVIPEKGSLFDRPKSFRVKTPSDP